MRREQVWPAWAPKRHCQVLLHYHLPWTWLPTWRKGSYDRAVADRGGLCFQFWSRQQFSCVHRRGDRI